MYEKKSITTTTDPVKHVVQEPTVQKEVLRDSTAVLPTTIAPVQNLNIITKNPVVVSSTSKSMENQEAEKIEKDDNVSKIPTVVPKQAMVLSETPVKNKPRSGSFFKNRKDINKPKASSTEDSKAEKSEAKSEVKKNGPMKAKGNQIKESPDTKKKAGNKMNKLTDDTTTATNAATADEDQKLKITIRDLFTSKIQETQRTL